MAGLPLESSLVAAIVLVLIALLSVGFASRPASAIPLVLAIEMAAASSLTLGVMVGQLHVYPADIIAVALVVAALMRWRQLGIGIRPAGALVVLLAVLLLGIARGITAFGL